MTSRPLSYEASKCVLQYLPFEQRLNILLRCPQLRTAEKAVPLKINTLQLDTYSLRLDHMKYKFTSDVYDKEMVRYSGANQIEITHLNRKTTETVNLKEHIDLDVRRAFLMHKLLSGRRHPVIFDNFKLIRNTVKGNSYVMEQNLCLPEGMKIKVKELEIYQLDAQVLQQLSSRIEGPVRTFRVLSVPDLRSPLFNCSLVNTALRMDFPIQIVPRSFNAISDFPQKELVLNNGRDDQEIENIYSIANMILARQLSNLGCATTIIIPTYGSSKDEVLERLMNRPNAQEAVVDDVESNLSNIPCVRLPMIRDRELNVYGVPGTRTESDLKIVVMPRGSAMVRD